MILVDTSVWVDHFRTGNDRLQDLLKSYRVLAHPFVTGEIALGNIRNRTAVLSSLDRLPAGRVASPAEVRIFIDGNGLAGTGVGYVDAHVLASTALTPGARLWTLDNRLNQAAEGLGLAF